MKREEAPNVCRTRLICVRCEHSATPPRALGNLVLCPRCGTGMKPAARVQVLGNEPARRLLRELEGGLP
jgi:hypothetical protein